MKEFIKYKLNEELTKSEQKTLQSFVLDSKELEKKIEKIVKDRIKSDKALEDKILEITRNVLTQLYKTLWIRRNFWRSHLYNKAT